MSSLYVVYLKMISELPATVPKEHTNQGTHQPRNTTTTTIRGSDFESEIIQVCPSGWSFVSRLLAAVRQAQDAMSDKWFVRIYLYAPTAATISEKSMTIQ